MRIDNGYYAVIAKVIVPYESEHTRAIMGGLYSDVSIGVYNSNYSYICPKCSHDMRSDNCPHFSYIHPSELELYYDSREIEMMKDMIVDYVVMSPDSVKVAELSMVEQGDAMEAKIMNNDMKDFYSQGSILRGYSYGYLDSSRG